jgi:hypothetical protein
MQRRTTPVFRELTDPPTVRDKRKTYLDLIFLGIILLQQYVYELPSERLVELRGSQVPLSSFNVCGLLLPFIKISELRTCKHLLLVGSS